MESHPFRLWISTGTHSPKRIDQIEVRKREPEESVTTKAIESILFNWSLRCDQQLVGSVFIEHCSSVLLYHKFDLKFSSKWTVWQDAGTCYRSETEAFRFEHTRCSINWCSIRNAKASSSTDSVRQYIHSFNSLSPASLDGCYVNFELRRVLSLRKLAKELLSPVESRKVSKIPRFESDECIQWAGFHSINFVNWDLNLELLRHAFRNFHIIF